MFRVPLLVAITLAIAFAGGIVSTLKLLEATAGFGSIRLGAWQAFPDAQTSAADPYARAHRAKGGRLLYGSAEGLVFQADEDDDGNRLDAACTYVMAGQTPIARAWTLYIARPDGGAGLAADGRPNGLNSFIVARKADSTFEVTLSREAQAGNWLALPQAGPFRLVLTLLDTPTAGSSGLIDLAMPTLQKRECAHG
ncbi:DUF1214 domain-containing protein [Gellertiella hungarica]|uniref:DUF1214 domain-containing protein n=1 Tax=Gellertiella hungarica TaxID=1572859 RepID=A0A7W6J6K5_9HYPH|nr:DUF1214 domain-containing protein [Gellertiella hungarica]MBB4065746.1 hypothetical protein [Gellertiella hungarica]